MFRSTNPVLTKDAAFAPAQPQGGYGQYSPYPQQQRSGGPQDPRQGYGAGPVDSGPRMTMEDVITKTSVIMGLMILVAAASWSAISFGILPQEVMFPMLVVGGLGTFVFSIVVAFRARVTPVMAVVFSILEGMFVGMISLFFESLYDGIVVQAVLGTLIVAAVMLAAYRFKVIRVTPMFTKILFISTISFALAMLVNFGLSFVGIDLGLRDGGTGPVSLLAIGVSILGVVLASLNLVLDFDLIDRGVRNGAPARQSWLAAFGLVVTMVWLYTEILRILSYFRR
ncbi:Bax inhibitor-1/YccA family protein [Auraticoccus monumenti]|uniref:Uncharacterized membrane protein, YccA/Bax inhibitor family n=1 Tax=Auraticoccus monumenti TaxID=675864 RepID=A0A1G6YUI4_9ACTN|nr:Bax inhibitor-1/YccA family protein [Auraticoccus monumenti]SDD93998.1 Uncharacterized membrane protein, YccA/Bax inhibitor family [Auraticoccus monumenti]